FFAQILREIGRAIGWDAHDVNAPPAGLPGQLARDIHVDPAIRDQVHMEPVRFVQLEYAKARKLWPSLAEERQQMIPALPRRLDVQDLVKSESPHVQRFLSEI